MGTLNCKKYGFCMSEILCKGRTKFVVPIVCVWGSFWPTLRGSTLPDRVPPTLYLVFCLGCVKHNMLWSNP